MTVQVRYLLLIFAVLFLSAPPAGAALAPTAPPATGSPQEIREAARQYRQELAALPARERRALRRQQRREIKDLIRNHNNGSDPSTDTLLLAILCVLLPPLAVYLYEGETNDTFWISVLLTLLLWLPGIIFAVITIFG